MGLCVTVLVLGAAVYFGGNKSPNHCGQGFRDRGARCCVGDATLSNDGVCQPPPINTLCPPPWALKDGACQPVNSRVKLNGGAVRVGPSDWEAQGQISSRMIEVRPFFIDSFEATERDVQQCVESSACSFSFQAKDPFRAATLSFDHAQQYCAFRLGRLPSDDEWTFAAMGTSSRRYPWGETGALCRRAAFGLVDGPCATTGVGPDSVGAHPSGATADGIFDLAGNVAEWVNTPSGARARGGSFRTQIASELRGWSPGAPATSVRPDEVGVRCAYDEPLGTSNQEH